MTAFDTLHPLRAARIVACLLLAAAFNCELLPAQHVLPMPPGDVLNPNVRNDMPPIMIGIRAGLNRSSYSNDRFLNNVPFDVGDVSGETEIYSSAAGFGYNVGIDLEYPLNRSFAILGTLEYVHSSFGSSGTVTEPCVRRDSTTGLGTSLHDFSAHIDFVKLGAAIKLDLGSWYLLGGLAAARPLSTGLDRTRTFGSTDCFFPGSGGQSTLEEHGGIPSPTHLHYAFRFGAGLNYQLSPRMQFAPELVLDFGMNAINKSPNSDLGIYALLATLRYAIQ
ncbi:MAG: hypothetical protein JST22_10560 [Bacteroidetes bacterium]|nr:hypothetical protein [Bacteroidota bacterium]